MSRFTVVRHISLRDGGYLNGKIEAVLGEFEISLINIDRISSIGSAEEYISGYANPEDCSNIKSMIVLDRGRILFLETKFEDLLETFVKSDIVRNLNLKVGE